MAGFQIWVDYLLSAGGNVISEANDFRLFFINQLKQDGEFVLSYRDYSGTTLGPLNKVVSGVKENTSAVYLCDNLSNPSFQLILCVSPSSTLRALEFDEDEDEWTDSSTLFEPIPVHPSGKLAAISDGKQNALIFFQDPAGRIIVILGSSIFQPLPADAIPSTPLSATFFNGNLTLFYIARDNLIHYLAFEAGEWVDAIFAQETFKQIPKRFVAHSTGNGSDADIIAISENHALVSISSTGNKTILGKVDANGKFSSETTEESGILFGSIWSPDPVWSSPDRYPYPPGCGTWLYMKRMGLA